MMTRKEAVRTALLLLSLCAIAGFVMAVDHHKFRRCDQSGFCRRNRDLAKQQEGESPFAFVPNTQLALPSGDRFVSEVVNRINDHRFRLEVSSYGDDVFRVHLNEKQPLRPRYEPADALLPHLTPKAPSKKTDSEGRLFGSVEITQSPLAFKFFDPQTGELLVEANGRGLLNFEELRHRPVEEKVDINIAIEHNENENEGDDDDEHLVAEQKEEPRVSPYKTFSTDGHWDERFSNHEDPKPFGPASVGIDFTFHNTENVYGIPEHASSFSLKTTVGKTDPYRLFNLDVFEYELDQTMALYGSVPFMLAQRKDGKTVGLFFLNASEMWIDIQHFPELNIPKVETHWFSESGVLDFFVLTGPTPKDVMSQYAKLTGTPQLPPTFSIAYHQCRWNYRDQDDVATVDAKFDENDIPYDVIWLDIEHTDGKRYFTWDVTKFPDSTKMIDSIAAKGRKMVTIVDPHIKQDTHYRLYDSASSGDLLVKNSDSTSEFHGSCWPGDSVYPDFSSPRVRQWWADQFQLDKYKGSTLDLFTWNDMNEPSVFNFPEVTMPKDVRHNGGSCGSDISLSVLPPSSNNNFLQTSSSSSSSSSALCKDLEALGENHPFEHRDIHNMYGFWLHQATFTGLYLRDPNHNQRPFVLSRAFFAGSQRYGAIWTGDNGAEWSHLAAAQPMLLSLSVAGISFCGADVGGFFGNPDAELMERWYQAGAFHPFFRGHAHLDSKRREPYLFPEKTTNIIRSALRQRYSLLPLWYTLFHEASVSGVPPMRPLWFEFPSETNTFSIEDQFLVGSDLLVKPITTSNTFSTQVYFPGSERWFELDTWIIVDPISLPPSRLLKIDAPAERIPVFQRGGSIVPRRERPRRSSQAMINDPFTLLVALDSKASAKGELYLDDGVSFDTQTKKFFHHRLFSFSEGKLVSSTIHKNEEFKDLSQLERIVVVGLASRPSSVSVVDPRTGETRELETQIGPNNSLIVKKPNVFVTDDWTISFSF